MIKYRNKIKFLLWKQKYQNITFFGNGFEHKNLTFWTHVPSDPSIINVQTKTYEDIFPENSQILGLINISISDAILHFYQTFKLHSFRPKLCLRTSMTRPTLYFCPDPKIFLRKIYNFPEILSPSGTESAISPLLQKWQLPILGIQSKR